jgi:phosphohistidine phosphatase SixA
MRVLLIRHARAGNRGTWEGDDLLRPLDKRGRRQAAALPNQLAEYPIDCLLSSPYVRCVETLEPLSEGLDLRIDVRPGLAEGSSAADVFALLAESDAAVPALCTHGDVVEELLGEGSAKGSVWVLELSDGGELRRERYFPPAA